MAAKKAAKKVSKKASQKAARKRAPSPETKESVFENLTLKGIRLIKVQSELQITDGKVPIETEVEMKGSCGPSADMKAILVDGFVATISRPKEPGENPSILRIQVHYQAVYHTAENVEVESFAPRAEELCTFGMMAMWPYIRELIQSISLRMTVPAITLPIILTGPVSYGTGNNMRIIPAKD